jgi:hypothetical protein
MAVLKSRFSTEKSQFRTEKSQFSTKKSQFSTEKVVRTYHPVVERERHAARERGTELGGAQSEHSGHKPCLSH